MTISNYIVSKVQNRKFKDEESEYKQIHKWCSKKHVNEWFEQRALSLEEIISKYKSKSLDKKQDLYFVKYNG